MMIAICGILVAASICTVTFLSMAMERQAIAQAPPPELKPYKESISGSKISFEMLPIPGGTFALGSPDSEKDRGDDESPQHQVTLKPFWMGKCEVSWDEYDLFCFSQDIP